MKDKGTSGVTLLEVIVVCVILAILASLALPNFAKTLENTRGRRAIANLRVIATAAVIYYHDTGDSSALTFNSLSAINTKYRLSLQDSDFTYTGNQTGSDFSFQATRNSTAPAPFGSTLIKIEDDPTGSRPYTFSGNWPLGVPSE